MKRYQRNKVFGFLIIPKLKTLVALILVLLLGIPITTVSASQIVIEDADTIWNVTSDYPPKLINTTENVTPRVTVECTITSTFSAYNRQQYLKHIPNISIV